MKAIGSRQLRNFKLMRYRKHLGVCGIVTRSLADPHSGFAPTDQSDQISIEQGVIHRPVRAPATNGVRHKPPAKPCWGFCRFCALPLAFVEAASANASIRKKKKARSPSLILRRMRRPCVQSPDWVTSYSSASRSASSQEGAVMELDAFRGLASRKVLPRAPA